MPCENAAQSNDYFEFIGEYSGVLDYVKEEFNTECITVIDQRFAIAYVKKNGRTSIYGQNYPYNTIPRCFGLMDTQMLEDVGVAQVRRSTLDLYGNGVLVGMIDTGIDYEHPAFRYEDGSSKIYSLWDQTIEGDPEDTFLGYGTEYTKEQIEEALKSDVPQQKVFQKDTVRKNDVDEIAKTYNYRVLISDGSGTIVYSSEGEKSLMYKSLWNILNENLDKISNQIKKQGYAVMTNTNKSMGTSINLMGYLDGDYTVIISTPMESIQTSARLSGQFTMYVGLILIICGAVAMYLYSRQFTRPIEDMAKAANQMSHLDFDVKVPTGSDDELGRLGASINELSSKLEFTISELKTANNELQKDIEQKVQIDEMRKEFLSHVSHELKTPIALVVVPTEVPRIMTTIYISALEAVSDNCFTTPLSRNRFPSISIPTKGAVVGNTRQTTMVTIIGNKIFSVFDTGRSCSILILRSSSVVSNFMIGG